MPAICNIEENKEFAQSIGDYINVSIIKSIETNTPYELFPIMMNVYDSLKDDNKVKALGAAAVVPQLFLNVLKLKNEYIIKLLENGFPIQKVYDFIKLVETAEDPTAFVAKALKITDAPTIAQTNNNLSYDPSSKVILTFDNSSTQVEAMMLTTNSFLLTSGDNRLSINQSNPDLNFNYKVQENLLKAQTDKDPTLSSVEYSGHTGFKLRLMLATNVPNPEKNIPGISLARGSQSNYVQVIVDNNGNYLFFDDAYKITTDLDKGKLVAFPQRNWNKVDTKKLFIESSLRAVTAAIKRETTDPAEIAIRTAAVEKTISQSLDKQIAELNQYLEDINNDKLVLSDITGGFAGSITNPDNITTDIQGNKLTAEQKNQIQKPLSEFKLSNKALSSILYLYNKVQLDNYPTAIPIKGTLIAEKDPGLLDTLIDLLTEDLVENGQPVPASRKKDLFHQFAFPARVKISYNNDAIDIKVDSVSLNLDDKAKAKEILKEVLSAKIKGAYFSVMKEQAKLKTYEEITVSGNTLTTKIADYLPFIAQRVIPKVIYDKTTGEAMIINGFFTYDLIKSQEQDNKEIKKIIDNGDEAVKKTGFNPDKINTSGFDRSKLLDSRANSEQKAAGDAWQKTSAVVNAKDSVTGKPLFPKKLLQNIVNSDAFATFSRSGFTLYNGSDSTHMYHEAWHAFSQVYMTYAERTRMYKAVTTLPGSFTVLRKVGGPGVNNIEKVTLNFKDLDVKSERDRRYIEEFIAEEFRTYAMNGGKFKVKNEKASKLERFFRAIWETLKALFPGVLPVNVYSNPGSQGVLSEAFNVLYTAKEASDLNNYSPSFENAEFGTLNAGAIYDTDGNVVLYPTETDLLRRSIDGIISATVNKLSMDPTKQGAAFEIFTNPKWIKNLYNNVIKEQLKEKAEELTKNLEILNEKVEKEKDELKQIVLKSDADTLANLVNTLVKALANYGSIDGILENKVSDNSIIAYHLNNSAYKDVIKNAIRVKDEDDKIPNPLERVGGVNANEIEASKLVTIDAVYILSGLVKENFVQGVRVTELNELGFPEPIEWTSFFNFLMQKIGGQQSITRLYNKLSQLKKLKINPLVDQLLDKMGNPEDAIPKNNASRMWVALTGALNPFRTDLINTQFITEKGETTVFTGKVSAPYFAIKNEIWPSKFSIDTSIFTDVNSDNQNTIRLSEVYNKFLIREQTADGNILYTLNPKTKASDFLSAIGIYLSDKSEAENRLREGVINNGLKQIYNIIGHAYKNKIEISDISKFLSKKNIFQGEVIVDGKSVPKPIAFSSLNGTVNALAQIEADLGIESSNQMVYTSDGELQSVFSQNSSFTRIGYALNSVLDSKEFGDKNSEFGYASHLYPGNNPSAGASIVLNSLYNPFSKTKNEDNEYEITVLSGAQHRVITDEDSDNNPEGTSSSNMTNTDRFVKDISSMLQAGYMEGVANGDKNTFVSGKAKKLNTYTNKKSNHLFIDTDALIIDDNGNWLTRVNPILEVYNMLIPKLDAELRRIAMYNAGISDEQAAKFGLKEGSGKDFYKKHVEGFENAGKFDFFEDVLENNQGIDIKQKLITDFLPQLSDTVTLKDLLNTDPEFRKLVGTEIWNYFKAVADQIMEQDYVKIFGNKLPNFLKQIATINIEDQTVLQNVSTQAIINAAVMSFAINGTLHTDEQLIIQFGNGYEFNHSKDEYSKRTSPYNSPGKINLSDDLAIAMLNAHVPREYEAKKIKDGKINKKEARAINRIGNKAIIQESVVRAARYDAFHDLFKKNFIKRGVTNEKELEILLYGEKDGEVGTFDEPIGGAMEAFARIKNADGQGWISFDFYRIIKWSENNWSDEQEVAYQKEINGEHISAQELVELFPPLKEGYAGPLALDKGILAIQSIDKFSLLPLVPSLVKDTPWEIIQDKMMEQDTDYTMMVTAAKRSFIKSGVLDANGDTSVGDPIFIPGDSSELDPRFVSGEITFTKNPFFMEYLKNQTEVNKEFKEEGTLSTQYRKIFDIGLYNGGVPVDANMSKEKWDELSETEKEEKSPRHKDVNEVFYHLEKLVKQMGIDLLDDMNWVQEDGEFKGSAEDMITYLKKKLESQEGYTEEDLAILDVSKPYEFPKLSISTAAARLEKFLFSIVNKKMIRLKVTGDPLVQASNVGMQSILHKFRGGKKLTDEERKKYTDKDLPGYDFNADGSITAMKVKIAITENYTNLYNTKYYSENAEGKYVENGIIAVYKTVIDPKTGKPILNEKTKKPVKVLDDELSLQRLNEMIRFDGWLNLDKNREKIQISGLRIPGQSPNSTEFGEVWQFLPASASNIIIIPAEVLAKAGGDFDVDKLNTYIKFISRQGTLLEDTMTPEEIEKELKEVDAVLKHRKADKLNINNSLDKFRKSIYKIAKHVNMTDEQIKSFTTRDYKKLLTTLADEKSLYFLKNNNKAKAAYRIYEKEIKGVTAVDYDGIQDVLESLYSTDSELFYYTKRKSDLMDYKNNYASVIMNSLVASIINVQKSPEMAFSILLPNGTYLIKPYADELKPVIQKADNLANFNVSIKTGKPIAGRSKGVSPTRAREYHYNKDRRQGNFDAKNSLSVIALEIPLNGIFNKIGAELEPTITETVKLPDNKGVLVEMDVTSSITIKLPHNYTNYGSAIKQIRAISVSKLLDADKINQVADVLSQLANGAVDAAKDNWIAYLQGNTEGITKILAMLEMGVPVGHIVYFINNPLIRKYIAIKRNKKSKLLYVYKEYNANDYDPTLFKTEYALNPALATPIGIKSKSSTNSFWGLSNMLKGYMEHQKLTDSMFNEEKQLKEVAYSSIDTKDNDLKSKQIAGFLQYLYIEKLVNPFDIIKKGIDVDTNTNVDSQTIFSKTKMIETAENEEILGKKTLKSLKETGMLSMFYPVLKFAKGLFGDNLFTFRTNPNLEKFIYNTQLSKKWKIQEATGYDEENFGNKFKNAVSLHAFTSQLKQYKEGSSVYKGVSITELFNNDSPVKSIEEVTSDYVNRNYIYDTKNANNFFKRKFYPIVSEAITDLTANDFVEIILEREFLRKKTMPFTDSLKNSRHFQSVKKTLKNTTLGQTLSDEELNTWAYEKLILNEALLNTFNYWQMFTSNDYSVADKFSIIRSNYKKELGPLYNNGAGKFLDRIDSNPLKTNVGTLLSKNLRIKDVKNLNKSLSSEFNLIWKKLANSGDIKKAVALKNAESNKYISNFFQQLPIFMFLQSGLNSSKYSFNKIMPTEDYINIMGEALDNFEKEYLTEKNQDQYALHGLYNLFIQINSFTVRNKLNRGNNYRKTKNQLLALAAAPLSLYTQPYIRPTDNKNVFLIDLIYSEDGVEKRVIPAMLNILKTAYKNNTVFLLNNKDLGITGTNIEENKAQITATINSALASGKTIVINSDGFGQTVTEDVFKPSKPEAPTTTDKFAKKNIFTVNPQPGVSDNKAKPKASISTQYIGFGEDIVGKDGKRSTTQIYREQVGKYANTGNYSASDVIFVSIPGLRGDAKIAKREQDKTIKEAIKAVEAGATILTDNKAYTDASSYNTGEKRLYDNMKAKVYSYSEITVDGQLIGTWSKSTQPSTLVQPARASVSQKSVASIPQNKVSGIESFGSLTTANPEVIKALGSNPHSIDMVEAGFRTRTTRSVGEVAKYKVKVGDVVKQFGTSADGTIKIVYTRITAIHPKGSPGWKDTWVKEGWRAEDVDVINKFKDGAEAIEFEVIKEDTDESTTCSTPPF
jgi:hypothetical protein